MSVGKCEPTKVILLTDVDAEHIETPQGVSISWERQMRQPAIRIGTERDVCIAVALWAG